MGIQQEAARHWLGVLKSSPWKDHWIIDDDRFLTNLAAAWPWIMVYFELLSRTGKTLKDEDFPLLSTMAVYALRETLGIRIDCAACLLFLFQISLLPLSSEERAIEYMKRLSKSLDQLYQDENNEEWLHWMEELWRGR